MQDQTIAVKYLTFEQFESQLTPINGYFQYEWRDVKPVTKGYEIEGDSLVGYKITNTDVLLLLPAGKIAVINKDEIIED